MVYDLLTYSTICVVAVEHTEGDVGQHAGEVEEQSCGHHFVGGLVADDAYHPIRKQALFSNITKHFY